MKAYQTPDFEQIYFELLQANVPTNDNRFTYETFWQQPVSLVLRTWEKVRKLRLTEINLQSQAAATNCALLINFAASFGSKNSEPVDARNFLPAPQFARSDAEIELLKSLRPHTARALVWGLQGKTRRAIPAHVAHQLRQVPHLVQICTELENANSDRL